MTKVQARAEKHVEAEEDKEDRFQVERELLAMGKKITQRVQAHQHYILGGTNLGEARGLSSSTTRHSTSHGQLNLSQEEWCTFHRAHDHTTEECMVFKSQIEKLIQDGYFGHFVKRKENEKLITEELRKRDRKPIRKLSEVSIETQRPNSPSSRNNTNNSWRRIHGRNVYHRPKKVLSKSVLVIQERPAQRRDPPITFTDEDYEGTRLYSNDPMVISIIIADYRVKQVLVDQGSSANVLFWQAFQKLGFLESSLEECPRTLIDFAGEQVEIRGVINLETKLGMGLIGFELVVTSLIKILDFPKLKQYRVNLGHSSQRHLVPIFLRRKAIKGGTGT
ncbi:hypothetical protein CR513_26881, partial [Mucuna pruriens]